MALSKSDQLQPNKIEMNAPDWSQISCCLHDQCAAIAADWRHAIGEPVNASLTAAEIQTRLQQLVTHAADILCATQFNEKQARRLGEALVELQYKEAAVLGQTQRVLAQGMVAGLTAEQAQAVYPRLTGLLAALAEGFIQQARQRLLEQQENIRHTLLETRKKAREALQSSEARYRILFESSPISIWEEDYSEVKMYVDSLRRAGIKDMRAYFESHPEAVAACASSVRVVDINQTTVSMYETESKDAFRQGLGTFFTEESFGFFREGLIAIAEGKTGFESEVINKTAKGRILQCFLRWSIPPGYEETWSRVLVSIIDVTPLKEAENQLRRHTNRLANLQKMGRAILAAQSPQEIAEIALAHLNQLVTYWGASVISLDFDTKEVTVITGSIAPFSSPGPYPMTHMEIYESLKKGRISQSHDIKAWENPSMILKTLQEHGVRTLLNIPLLVQEELIGALTLVSKEIGAFDEDDIEVAREVADILAIAIANARLLEAERIAKQQAETLREVASVLGSKVYQEHVLDVILEQLARVIQYDSASVLLRDGNRLKVAAHEGEGIDSLSRLPLVLGEMPLVEGVLMSCQPRIVTDTENELRWTRVPGYEYIRSWMGVPLTLKDEAIGLLTLDHRQPRRYKKSDAALAQAFADQAAVAIENARLLESVRQHVDQLEQRVMERTRELQALYDITAAAGQYLNLQQILDQTLARVLEALECSAGVIHLLSESDEVLPLAAAAGIPPDCMAFFEPPAAAGLIAQVIVSDKSILIPDLANDPRWSQEAFCLHGFLEYLGAPIRSHGRVMGAIGVFGGEDKHFGTEEVALLSSIAEQIGVAVENEDLRRKAEQSAVLQERQRLARDLHDAVTQNLYSLTLLSNAAVKRSERGEYQQLQELLSDIETTANKALKEMRLMLYELRGTTLAEEGLVAALRNRLEAVEKRTAIDARLLADPLLELPQPIEEAFFYIALEGLNNAQKHAAATTVTIEIHVEGDTAVLEIRDNGRGFRVEEARAGGGMGLGIMHERAEQISGTLVIESTPGLGTLVRVQTRVTA